MSNRSMIFRASVTCGAFGILGIAAMVLVVAYAMTNGPAYQYESTVFRVGSAGAGLMVLALLLLFADFALAS